MVTDSRQQQLTDWLRTTHVPPNGSVEMVSGDASFRRYFRFLHASQWFIAVDAPPPQESLQPFMAIAQAYREQGLHAPKVHAYEQQLGFMVLDDFGDTLLFQRLVDDAAAEQAYQQALGLLPGLMRVTKTTEGPLPAYDIALLQRELSLFSDWLVQHHLGLELNSEQHGIWHAACDSLIDNALQQPQVGVHRDFHSRNLMWLESDEQIAVIDFQDAVQGPITYDAVSLLRDCYVRWPDALVASQVERFYLRLKAEQLLPSDTTLTQFTRWFDFMGIQRHLKAAGIFARLLHRDGKAGYMADVPRTLGYIIDISAKYPELASFSQWVSQVREQFIAQPPTADIIDPVSVT